MCFNGLQKIVAETLCGDFRLKRSRNVHFMWWESFSSSVRQWSNYEDGIKRQIEHASYSLESPHFTRSKYRFVKNFPLETVKIANLVRKCNILINCMLKPRNNSFAFRIFTCVHIYLGLGCDDSTHIDLESAFNYWKEICLILLSSHLWFNFLVLAKTCQLRVW